MDWRDSITLRDMLPYFPQHDVTGRPKRHSVLFIERLKLFRAWDISSSNFSHDCLSQLCSTLTLAFCLPVFCHHIRRIIGMCSKEKMVWITTLRLVALVANKNAIWNRPIRQSPRNTVRHVFFPISENSIKRFTNVCASFPHPTFIWRTFGDLLPKSYFGWTRSVCTCTRNAATDLWSTFKLKWNYLEFFSADRTVHLHRNTFLFNSGATRPAFHCAVAFREESSQ